MALNPDDKALLERVLSRAPVMPAATIDWSGDKDKVIKTTTWEIPFMSERLARAQLDLIKAGFEEDARLLTTSKLNGCWSAKLTQEERNAMKAKRVAANDAHLEDAAVRKRPRPPKSEEVGHRGKHRSPHARAGRQEEADAFSAVSTSIGLMRRSWKRVAGGRIDGDDEATVATGHSLEIEQPKSYTEGEAFLRMPLACSQIIETHPNDAQSKTLAMVRICGAGTNSRVAAPTRDADNEFSVIVERTNQRDLVTLLDPNAAAGDIVQRQQAVESRIKGKFGQHTDYATINNAFSAMVPEVDTWTVRFRVQPPYTLGPLNDFFVIRSPSQGDAVLFAPLVREQALLHTEAEMFDLGNL